MNDSTHEWRSQENRESSKCLEEMQHWFDERQDALRNKGCSNADITTITSMNKIQRVVSQCKENHGGPLTKVEELDSIIKNTVDEKQLSRILDLEIRYRKFTMTKVKSDCPLFLQRKLTNEQKIENIRLLMESQDLGLKAVATMEDLIKVIGESNETDEPHSIPTDQDREIDDDSDTEKILSTRLTSQDQLSKDEFILGMFEDGFYPGQVLKDCGDKIDALFMTKATIANSDDLLYWKWPTKTDRQIIRKVCILKIRPNLDIAIELSTRRCIIFKLLNLEFVNKFVA